MIGHFQSIHTINILPPIKWIMSTCVFPFDWIQCEGAQYLNQSQADHSTELINFPC